MKIRIQATATYLYYLLLNPMMSNAESQQQFGPFDTRELALAFYNTELVEPYDDTGPDLFGRGEKTYRKSFRKDGPLEWCNKLTEAELEKPGPFGHGIHEVLGQLDDVQTIG